MIPTELQRLILMVALAATGYLMILAWSDDYGEAAQRSVVAASPDLDSNGSADITGAGSFGAEIQADDVPDAQGLALDSDMPDDSLALPPGSSAPSPVSPKAVGDAATSRLVKVFTDNLEVWLDLRGGDIVRTRLPKYPVTLEQPDEAFTLLDRSGGRTYIAQSGLIGCLLYTSPSPRDQRGSRMPSSA